MQCPYCGIKYNSPETFNAHLEGCLYKDCPQPVKTDLDSLSYQELKNVAYSKGIKAGNMKKSEIIKALKELKEMGE